MKARMMKFEEMMFRQDEHILGGTVEFDFQSTIYRGEIHDIVWHRKAPYEIVWTMKESWLFNAQLWEYVESNRLRHVFGPKMMEFFTGPFETDSQEIFFVFQHKIFVTIFPCGIAPPAEPRSKERHQCAISFFKIPAT